MIQKIDNATVREAVQQASELSLIHIFLGYGVELLVFGRADRRLLERHADVRLRVGQGQGCRCLLYTSTWFYSYGL